jgi:pyruvate kinase
MRIKDIASRLNCACIIIADLAGEKIRIGNFQAQKVEIKANDIVTFLAPIGPSNISSREFSVT